MLVLEGMANVEARTASEVLDFAGAVFCVDDDAAADGAKGGDIIVEWNMEVLPL